MRIRERFEAAMARAAAGHVCGADSFECKKCCEHGDTDGTRCLDCGSDIAEFLQEKLKWLRMPSEGMGGI